MVWGSLRQWFVTFEGWITVADCQPSYSGNYSCVPSYTTPDWVIVDVIKGNRHTYHLIGLHYFENNSLKPIQMLQAFQPCLTFGNLSSVQKITNNYGGGSVDVGRWEPGWPARCAAQSQYWRRPSLVTPLLSPHSCQVNTISFLFSQIDLNLRPRPDGRWPRLNVKINKS